MPDLDLGGDPMARDDGADRDGARAALAHLTERTDDGRDGAPVRGLRKPRHVGRKGRKPGKRHTRKRR